MPAALTRFLRYGLATAMAAAAAPAAVHGQSPNPVLTSIFPPGGKAGTTFDVTAIGEREPRTLLTCRTP